MTEHHVDRDPVEPGGKQAVAPEGRQLLPRPQVALLSQLLGQVRITAHPETERVDPSARELVEFLEGRHLATHGAGNQSLGRGLGVSNHGDRRRRPIQSRRCFHTP